MVYVIDRIAGEWAVCEKENGDLVHIPLSCFEETVTEGDVILEDQGELRLDREETTRRQDQMKKRLRDLI